MPTVLVGAMGRRVDARDSHISINGPSAFLGFWEGRGGTPYDKIDRIIRRHEAHAGKESARITLAAIRKNIPRRTGRTARTFEIREHHTGMGREWRIGSSADNALWLENGTGIYGPRHRAIEPRTGKWLKFPAHAGGGFRLDDTPRVRGGRRHPRAGYVYKRSVKGMKPRRYLERTAREVRPLIIRLHKDAARNAAMELKAR